MEMSPELKPALRMFNEDKESHPPPTPTVSHNSKRLTSALTGPACAQTSRVGRRTLFQSWDDHQGSLQNMGRGRGRDKREAAPNAGCLLPTHCLSRKCASKQGLAASVAATPGP